MRDIKIIGIDLAKRVFYIHATDERGNAVHQGKYTRSGLIKWLMRQKPSLVGMEACSGANHYSRIIKAMGHEVKLIAPQHVKAYVRGNKNDLQDASAIAEAVSRPRMRFVAPKTERQQQIQAWHRIRSTLIAERTRIINEIHALTYEYGVVMPRSWKNLKDKIQRIIKGEQEEALHWVREDIQRLYKRWRLIDEEISHYEEKIGTVWKEEESCQRLMAIPGVGPLSATAIISAVGDTNRFGTSREFAAWLGLVPKHEGSGGKNRILGISKRGDKYIRSLLIHGGRAVVSNAHKRSDSRSVWIQSLKERRGMNKAAVAMAHKNARIIWRLLAKGEEYRKAA